jgi:hypothetical protein
MFIPLRHENNEGRRWPVISLALIVINLAVFLGTHWQMDEQSSKDSDVPAHILLLAAMHPQLSMPPDVGRQGFALLKMNAHCSGKWTRSRKNFPK